MDARYKACYRSRPSTETAREIDALPSGIDSEYACKTSPPSTRRSHTGSPIARSTVAPSQGLAPTSTNGLFFRRFYAASPDGAECGNKSRAAHSFSEIYSSALRSFPSIQSCPRSRMGARGARIIFGAEEQT
ncbi:hypothetical protein B0H13DRAFT_1889870 [Mycena leptocephala]|nr:hypothetical protein B0H13DRAFT_1889870 [Mycena leptocephala]